MSAFGDGWRLVEEAPSGRTTVLPDPITGVQRNGLAVLPAVLGCHAPVNLVVLMLGTNDLKARFQMTPFDVSVGLERLVCRLSRDTTGG